MPVNEGGSIEEDLKVLDEVEQESDVEIPETDSEDSGDSDESGDDSGSDQETRDGEGDESEGDGDESEQDVKDEESIFAKVKKLAPNIFKEIPELRPIIAKERQYSEVFATPEEAKEASEKVNQFRELSDAVMAGNSSAFFNELVESDPAAYAKFAKDILPTVKKADPKMFLNMIIPHIKDILRNSMTTAKSKGDKNLYYGLGHVSKHLFGSPTIPNDNAPEVDEERAQFEKEKEEHKLSQLESFETTTATEIESALDRNILRYIDPNKVLTEKQRNAMLKDCKEELTAVTIKDRSHMDRLKTLRREAQRDGLTREASEKIKNTILARVKPLLASVSEKVRKDYAFDKRTQSRKEKKFIPSSGSSGSSEGKKINSKNVDYRNSSDLDILDGKVKYRS